jgi:hypothetical protein
MRYKFLSRSVFATVSLAMTAFLFTGTATTAFAQGSGYSFSSGGAASLTKVIVRDTLWRCVDGTCTTPSITSRPEVACAAVARKVGKLSSFNAAGRVFDEAALSKCNTKARS